MSSGSLWRTGMRQFGRDRLALASAVVFVLYAVVALLAAFGVLAPHWNDGIGEKYLPPSSSSAAMWLGTDLFGRSVFYKVLHGARIALSVGLMSTLISTPPAVVLGLLAGYFGGWIDEVVVWLYSVLSSVPNIMLLIAVTYMLDMVIGRGIVAMYIALSLTAWVGLARLVRGEVLRHRSREYVLAAESLGASHASRIFRHILPNVWHLVIVSASSQFAIAIKAEVVLSFLGLGPQGQPSWGVMIDDARVELSRGVWWQLAGATAAMFLIVLALNILGDALRDALDPRIQ